MSWEMFQSWSSLTLHCHSLSLSRSFLPNFVSNQDTFQPLYLLFPPLPPHFLLCVHLEKYNFLGISIVGQSNDRGDGGIYIGSIMKGGAVAADGRIEPGDMLLQVGPCPQILLLGPAIPAAPRASGARRQNLFILREMWHKDHWNRRFFAMRSEKRHFIGMEAVTRQINWGV